MSAPPDDAAGEGEGKPRPRTDSSVASLEVGNGSGSGGNMGDPNNNVPLVAINPVTGLPVEDPTVHVIDAKKKVELVTIHFKGKKIISKGSFGSTIILATIGDTEEQVVIKKIPQNKKYKNRELFILKQLQQLPHPYILSLKHHFSTSESRGLLKASEKFLNLVFEYIPENLDSLLRQYNQSKQTFPVFLTQLYMYQLGRAVAHLHGMGVSHRDIQPRNLLIDPVSMWLKLCDFSSAKSLNPDQASQSYVCSRFYRAPELILGSTNYTTAVDIWSIGCVFVEMITGSPFFAGKSGADHLFEIVKVLGSPTPEHLMGMNINISEDKKINFPALTQAPFESFFRIETPESAIDIASKMIQYIPSKRPLAIEIVAHRFFDNLRNINICKSCKYLNGKILPVEMFQLTNEEMSLNVDLFDILLTEDLMIMYHDKTPEPEFEEVLEAKEPEPEPEDEPVPDVDYDEFNFEGDSGDDDNNNNNTDNTG